MSEIEIEEKYFSLRPNVQSISIQRVLFTDVHFECFLAKGASFVGCVAFAGRTLALQPTCEEDRASLSY